MIRDNLKNEAQREKIFMERILDCIDSPEDLRKLKLSQLEKLAGEVREEIVRVVSERGGHLASNLGVVELTIALHYVFDTPRDKLLWDVGHQVYTHKLLTGRRGLFGTLRQWGGLSGFPKRAESPYDTFDVGHSGTSISSGLAFAEALNLLGENHKVVAVIGDGSMTAGLAFEGLNQAGHLKKDFILVLNDNVMSISANVGALSSYLSRLMTGKVALRVRKDIQSLLGSIPLGGQMLEAARRLEDSLKTLVSPGMLFEELGIRYVGPITGHSMSHLVRTFQNVKKMSGPVLVHVVTKKGKGYAPAEASPECYHGVPPFDPETGRPRARATVPSYTTVFGKTLVRLARADERVVGITAAMPEGTGLEEFAQAFPKRFYDVGIAEAHGVTFAAGLAAQGFRPVAAIYSTFLQRAYDQIVHDVCLQNLPVTFAIDRSGLVGEDGPTHHGVFDICYMRHLPNMVLMAPRDENELQHMLKTALYYPGPAALRYPRGGGVGVELEEELRELPIGRGEVLREGDDLAFLAIGNMVYPALGAAELLEEAGLEAAVVDMRFVKPLDTGLLEEMARSARRLITVEEGALQGGFGSAVLECLSELELLEIPVKRIGLPDSFAEHGPPSLLRPHYGLDPEGIAHTAREFLEAHLGVTHQDSRYGKKNSTG